MKIIYENIHHGELGSQFRVRIIDTETPADGQAPKVLHHFAPGFSLNYMATGADELNTPVIGSEITMHIEVDREEVRTMLQTIAGNDDYRYMIEVLKNNKRFWIGFVEYNGQSFEDLYYPYSFDMKAVDGLGRLADVPFIQNEIVNTGIAQRRSISNIIFDVLGRMELQGFYSGSQTFLKLISKWRAVVIGLGSVPLGPLENSFDVVKIDPFIFQKIENDYASMTCLEVLEMVLISFNLRIFQADGVYVIEQINEKQQAGYNAYHYNYSGQIFEILNNQKYLNTTADILTGAKYSFLPAIREATLPYRYYDMDVNIFPHPAIGSAFPQQQVFDMLLPVLQGDTLYLFNKTVLDYSAVNVSTSIPRVPLVKLWGAQIWITDGVKTYYLYKNNDGTASWAQQWMFYPTRIFFNQFPFYNRGDNSRIGEAVDITFIIPPAPITGTVKVMYEILLWNTDNNQTYTPPAGSSIGSRSYAWLMKFNNSLSGLVERRYSMYNSQPGVSPSTPIRSSSVIELNSTYIGDGPLSVASGAMFDNHNRLVDRWQLYADPRALGELLLRELLVLRKNPVPVFDGEIRSNTFSPLQQLQIDGKLFSFIMGSYTSDSEIWQLNMFQHVVSRTNTVLRNIQNITDDSAGNSTPGSGSGSSGSGSSNPYFAGTGLELINGNTFQASPTLRKIAEANNQPTWNGNPWPGAFPEAPNSETEVYVRGSLSWIAGITKSVFDTLKNAFDTHVLSKVHVPDPTGQPDGKILETQEGELVYADKPGRNIDGGRASSVYLPSQKISGGNA
jgi:hypothetical protein